LVFVSVSIGFVIAFADIFSRYPRKSPPDIFCMPFFCFMILNGALAALTYYLLPIIWSHFEYSTSNALRAVIAGLSYALILKSKLFTIKLERQELSVGPAFIYDSLSNYFLRNVAQSLDEKEWRYAAEIAQIFPELETYILAVNTVWMSKKKNIHNQLEQEDVQRLKSLRNQIIVLSNRDTINCPIDHRVAQAALLLLRHFGSKSKVNSLLSLFVS